MRKVALVLLVAAGSVGAEDALAASSIYRPGQLLKPNDRYRTCRYRQVRTCAEYGPSNLTDAKGRPATVCKRWTTKRVC